MGEVGAAYEGCRARITELTAGLGAEAAAIAVPACPGWTVHDVVAHLAGVVEDMAAGRVEGIATEAWTAAQVEAGRDRSLAELLEAWRAGAATFAGLLDSAGRSGHQAVFDAVTHEHDVRGALGRPGARDSDAVGIGVAFVAEALTRSAQAEGVALRVELDGGRAWGPDEPAVTLRGDAFEIMRAAAGRRSLDQLRALRWDGDPDAALTAFTFGPFRPADHPIEE